MEMVSSFRSDDLDSEYAAPEVLGSTGGDIVAAEGLLFGSLLGALLWLAAAAVYFTVFAA
jgi:hypothetical protein